jgi:transcription elongation factor GreA
MDHDNIVTKEGLASLQVELNELEGPRRRELAGRIKTAREWGDLKENSEYHEAKNEQAHLETKIARLRDRINSAMIVESLPQGGEIVAFGSKVLVRDEQGREQTWTLVSSHEGSPKDGRLSIESPVAVALMGHRPGEEAVVASPRGARRLTVVSVS